MGEAATKLRKGKSDMQANGMQRIFPVLYLKRPRY